MPTPRFTLSLAETLALEEYLSSLPSEKLTPDLLDIISRLQATIKRATSLKDQGRLQEMHHDSPVESHGSSRPGTSRSSTDMPTKSGDARPTKTGETTSAATPAETSESTAPAVQTSVVPTPEEDSAAETA
ncbi:hypothetical protein D9611_002084 [Ephemerocybe angulata]|uniref:Uncharacterized protein n=1 Tax=Ephemerocybe angulata TaxID=980116 RepID=A0A8H5CH47_9AGAR|nr:hypothetical protein D9611_002084 [Tulosesus angulatus]